MSTHLTGNVHLVAGGGEMIERVLEVLGRTGIETKRNPDIFIREYLQFGIDDARELRARASTRAINEDARVFIISASQMTADAQNALLKTLEEPSSGALFFIIVPTPETLLETLRSRAQILLLSGSHQKEKVVVKEFMTAMPAVRVEMVKVFLPKEGEERNIGAIIGFLSSLEKELAKIGSKKAKEGLVAIYRARKYIADKGSMLKHLLEQVALLTPRV